MPIATVNLQRLPTTCVALPVGLPSMMLVGTNPVAVDNVGDSGSLFPENDTNDQQQAHRCTVRGWITYRATTANALA